MRLITPSASRIESKDRERMASRVFVAGDSAHGVLERTPNSAHPILSLQRCLPANKNDEEVGTLPRREVPLIHF